MPFFTWLKENSEPIKTIAVVIQSIAVIGGIIAAVHAFILSSKVEEREASKSNNTLLGNSLFEKIERDQRKLCRVRLHRR